MLADVIGALCAIERSQRKKPNMTTTEPRWPDVSTYDRAMQIGRTNWQVTISIADLLVHATDAAAYHFEREEWWHAQAEDVKDTIGVSGLEVREQEITGGMRHDIVIDPALLARLNECETKAAGHRSKRDALARWDAFLGASTGQVVLTATDAEFFEIGQHKSDDLPLAHSAADLGRTDL